MGNYNGIRKSLEAGKMKIKCLEKVLEDFPEEELETMCDLGINSARDTIRLTVANSDNIPVVLKMLHRLGYHLKMVNSFYCSGDMNFIWREKYVELWYCCSPDNVPEELLPSKDCVVNKVISKPEVDYVITCPINKGEEI